MKKLILIFYVIISFKTLSVENLRFEVEKIDENLFKAMESLAPFGLDNNHPLFIDKIYRLII